MDTTTRPLQKVFAALVGVFFYPIFIFLVFATYIEPLMTFDNIRAVMSSEAPKSVTPLVIFFLMSLAIYLAIRFQSLGHIFRKMPVLLPAAQMALVSAFTLDIGLRAMNLWADGGVISERLAVAAVVASFLVGRAFLSYWYFKHPISSKL